MVTSKKAQFDKIVDTVSSILIPNGFLQNGCFWKKDCDECFVGLRLGGLNDSKAVNGFFGCDVKAISSTTFEDFNIGIQDCHIHGRIRPQVSGVDQIKFLCSMTLDNSQFEFTRDWLNQDPEFNILKLNYLVNPPYKSDEKLALFSEIFNQYTLPFLNALETEEGVKALILDENVCFSIWKSLALYLGVISSEQVQANEVDIGEYNYKTFVTL